MHLERRVLHFALAGIVEFTKSPLGEIGRSRLSSEERDENTRTGKEEEKRTKKNSHGHSQSEEEEGWLRGGGGIGGRCSGGNSQVE